MNFNTLRLIDKYNNISISKVIIIGSDNGCRLNGAKPLSEQMLEYS